ncbi:MAG: MBOAT family protein [Proteobacteria bacterium]|nr:MBOAT family protein [Pseudomonadota bacterium]
MTWHIRYIGLLFSSTAVTYGTALLLARHSEKKRRKLYLSAGVGFTLGILFIFKYFNFFNHMGRTVFRFLNVSYSIPDISLPLPVGISFYTFFLVGYLIDIYRNTAKAEKHFGVFAAAVAFFPLLLAGPIERAKSFLPQFFEEHQFDFRRVQNGVILMLWGFFKKLVIADRLAIAVNQVYQHPEQYHGLPLIVASIFIVFQVYCDFSGYCDIALGAAQVLGFRLTNNFNRPFASRSVSEFWRRWHISLSTWMRDYVYYPLALNKHLNGKWGIITATLITFGLIGLWHGAEWKYLFMGCIYGAAIAYEILTKKVRLKIGEKIPARLYDAFCLIATFCLINFSFIFFKAANIQQGFYIVTNMFSDFELRWIDIGLSSTDIAIALAALVLLEAIQLIQSRVDIEHYIATKPRYMRWTVYYTLVFAIIIFGIFSDTKFIYFNF